MGILSLEAFQYLAPYLNQLVHNRRHLLLEVADLLLASVSGSQ